jgi:hypothetical protein
VATDQLFGHLADPAQPLTAVPIFAVLTLVGLVPTFLYFRGWRDQSRSLVQVVAQRSLARKALLVCGVASSLLYVATDVFGGMRYPGYSFSSQAISELMAVGAPSEAFVDPLFITYGALVFAFGVGVFREGAGRSRALRIAGALLVGYAAIGFTGPTLFEMHQRGTGRIADDTPHIVLTSMLVLLTLTTVAFGAFAFGKRFSIYSLATLLLMIVFGVLAAPYGARLAAGEPTPEFGIVERINVYSSLLWVAVLAVALLRRPRYGRLDLRDGAAASHHPAMASSPAT